MPRGRKTVGVKGSLPPFLACNLSPEDLAHCQAHVFEDAGVVGLLIQCCELNYRVSVTYDDYNDCYSVVITSKPDEAGKGAVALSSRGPDLASACTVASYKLNEKLDCDLSRGDTAQSKQQWS